MKPDVDLAAVTPWVGSVYYIQFLINHDHCINDTTIHAARSTSEFPVEINNCLGNYLAKSPYSQPNGRGVSWFAVRFSATVTVILILPLQTPK